MKKITQIFVAAFLLNLIWENLHSLLYVEYMGGKITQMILLHATLVDALIITALSLPFVFIPALKNKSWAIILGGIFISILIEIWALHTGRWSYNEFMSIIPILEVGLTPAIQLGLLGYLSFRVVGWKFGGL